MTLNLYTILTMRRRTVVAERAVLMVLRAVTVGLLLVSSVVQAQFFASKKPDLLPEHEAFQVGAEVRGQNLHVYWSIANDYYMYREQFGIAVEGSAVKVGDIVYPKGVTEDDPEFGAVEVYFYNVELVAPLQAGGADNGELKLVLKGQGCNKPVGVCYPPQTRNLVVSYPGDAAVDANSDWQQVNSQKTDTGNADKSFMAYVLGALVAGLLLSFTPCVLPMIPILAGVIAREQYPGKLRSGWLACCYVGGTIITYMAAGWLAGAAGTQLQAYFQNPWVIGFVCGLLILLAASLFGWFRIELPASLQSRLSGASSTGLPAPVASLVMGLISALVVGACVSPILILTLGAAISQGDPVLGAAIMGAMALGMGLLLILFGFGAGWILPRSGPWMQQIQVVFGFMVLGVAIYLASPFAAVPGLLLWAALLLVAGIYCWQMAGRISAALPAAMVRATAIGSIIWGALAVVGSSSGGEDILRPLDSLNRGGAASLSAPIQFEKVTTLPATKQLLAEAREAQQPVLVDFYADWCLDCKRMQRTTFRSASVVDALQDWRLIEIDVTKNSDDSREVKKYFDVYGPPATLFIRADGKEHGDLRQYGYMNEEKFMSLVNASLAETTRSEQP